MDVTPEQKYLLENASDYIICPKYNNSLKALCKAYPDGVPNKTIASVLGMTKEELELCYAGIAQKLRALIEEDDRCNYA